MGPKHGKLVLMEEYFYRVLGKYLNQNPVICE